MSIQSIFSGLLLFVLLVSCESKKNTSDSSDLLSSFYNTSWELDSWKSESEMKELFTMQTIHLLFDDQKQQLSGNDGCNDFFAGFKLDGEKLNVGPTGGTKKYCGDESAKDERAFTHFLEQNIRAEMNGKKLQLSSTTEVLIFKAKN